MSKKALMTIMTAASVFSGVAHAKVYVNSMCTMKENGGHTIEGDDKKDKKFPLASISKVVTTLWSIESLGADYRFKTRFHVDKVGEDLYDVHIEGSRDPLMGRSAGYFLVSELSKKSINIRNIRRLTFDENLLMGWNVEEKNMIGGSTPYFATADQQIESVKQTLASSFASAVDASRYAGVKNRAARLGVDMVSAPRINVESVEFVSKNDFRKSSSTVTWVYKSAPLKNILKNMNNHSNNYIADNLYWNLGGTEAFKKWTQDSLSLDSSDIEFYLGSGNNASYIYGGDEVYSSATCESMVKIVYRLDQDLEKAGLQLSDVMAVAGKDQESTVAGFGGVMAGSTIAKTGSVNKAKTLTGAVSTNNGVIYFAVLMHTDQRSEWGEAQSTIKSKITDLINRNGGNSPVKYSEILTLPFDKGSYLGIETDLGSKG